MLKAQKRHRPPCKKHEWDQGYPKCGCPVVIRGTLSGKHITLSTAKYLPPEKARDLEAARDLAILWERSGEPVRPGEYAPIPATEHVAPPLPTVEMAVAAYIADARDRGNGEATLYKKATVFERTLITARDHEVWTLAALPFALLPSLTLAGRQGNLSRARAETWIGQKVKGTLKGFVPEASSHSDAACFLRNLGEHPKRDRDDQLKTGHQRSADSPI